MHEVTISLPDERAAVVSDQADREGTSVSEVVRRAVGLAYGREDQAPAVPFAALADDLDQGSCIAALAKRLGTDLVLTLERRHLLAARLKSGGSFRLHPEESSGTLELVERRLTVQKRETPTLELVESGRLLDGGVYWNRLDLSASLRGRRAAFK